MSLIPPSGEWMKKWCATELSEVTAMAVSGVGKALNYIKNLPRVTLGTLKPLPGQRLKKSKPRGQYSGRKCGRGNKGQGQRNTLPRVGFEGNNTPFYLIVPKEPYYTGHHVRRQYPPVSLMMLQRLIDMGQVDPDEPIDLTTLCNTKIVQLNPKDKHYGFNLTDEGVDIFKGKVRIEVQQTNETVIAAIERNGGTILTRFYDLSSIEAMKDPKLFFEQGLPIPRCKLPPQDALEYYSDPKNRGYLSDPEQIMEARLELAQKYGYKIMDEDDELYQQYLRRKDPRQIWHGLEPGWVVNIIEKAIYKPSNERLKDYYRS